ncbi:MAG: hypothetical protein IKY83_11750, partial [Proteobacteria bacterium]|nr:hypothetical protein [Pseudomonadota bacterium]
MGLFGSKRSDSDKVTTKNAAQKSATAGDYNDKKVADVYFHINTSEGIGPESSHGWLQICSASDAVVHQETNDPLLAAPDLRKAAGKSQKYFDSQLETMLGFAAYDGSTSKGHVVEPDFQIKPQSSIRYALTGAQYKAMFAYINDKREHKFSSLSYNSLTFASHALQAAGIAGVESVSTGIGAKMFLKKQDKLAKKEKEKGAFKQDIGLQAVTKTNAGTNGHKRDMAEIATGITYDRYYGGVDTLKDHQDSFFQDKGAQRRVADVDHRKAYMKIAAGAKSRVNEGQRQAFANWISDSGSFSKFLRDGDQSKAEMLDKVKKMDSVFEQEESALPMDMTVYRGVNNGMIKYLLEKKGVNPKHYMKGNAFDIHAAKKSGALKKLKGMSYSDQCYVSTSTNKGFAVAWNQMNGNEDQKAAYKTATEASQTKVADLKNTTYDFPAFTTPVDKTEAKRKGLKWSNDILDKNAAIQKQYKEDGKTLDNLSQNGAGHIMTIKLPKGTRGVFSDAMSKKGGTRTDDIAKSWGANQNEITLDRGLRYNIKDFTISENGNMELDMSVTGYSKHRKSYGKYDADADKITPEQTARLSELMDKYQVSQSPEIKAKYEAIKSLPLLEQ